MVALAVLGLAFAISYATATHALNSSQNSQEHGQALQILDSQVEMARSNAGTQKLYDNPGHTFCINPSTQAPTDDASDPSCQITDGGANYQVSVEYTPTSTNGVTLANFTFSISWEGIGNLGNQQESLNYQLPYNYGAPAGGAGATGGSGISVLSCPAGDLGTYPDCVQPGSLAVVAKKIAPDTGNTTPSCSEAASQNVAGTNIGLYLGGNEVSSQTTGGNSTATFNNLLSGSNYTAQIDGVPSGYEACAPTSQNVTVAPNTTTTVNLKIRPICSTTTNTSYQYLGEVGGGWVQANQLPYVFSSGNYYYEYVGSGFYWNFNGITYEYAYLYLFQMVTSLQSTCPS